MNATARRVAVLGGSRIPFARQNGPYARASNQDMLTATLDALAGRFGLEGEVLGEVAAGAVLKHSRDFNLTRESVLGSRLAPETPAYDVQQACGTGLEATVLVANKIALGQIDVGIAGGVDTTSDAPIAINEDLRAVLLELNRTKSNAGRLKTLARLRPQQLVPQIPRNVEPRTGLSMGEHTALMAREWGIGRDGAGRAGRDQPPQPRGRLRHGLDGRSRHALPRSGARPEPAPGLERGEAGQAQARLRRARGHDDRGQLDAAVRRRVRGAAGLRGLGEGPRHPRAGLLQRRPDRRRRLRPQARGPAHGAGLRDAEDARAQPARAAGLRLLRDPRGVRRPGPVHAQGVGGPGVLLASGSGATSRWARSTATASTSTAARSARAIRSAPPAGGSSPRWPRR